MIEYDEIITVIDTISTKTTNIIARNVTSTVSINFHSKKVTDCNILHGVFLLIIFLLIDVIVCYYYAKQKFRI